MSLQTGPQAVVDGVKVHVATDAAAAGAGAAGAAAAVIRASIAARGSARVVLASAPSQESMLAALVTEPSIDWSRVHAFHMDEYVGLADDDPRGFGAWLHERLASVPLGRFDQIRTDRDPPAEMARYAALLAERQPDLTCLGIGMNGHVAFNEPGAAFDDAEPLRAVELDQVSRRQQVEEGLFGTLDEVPTQALTLTIPSLLRSRTLVATVLGGHKAAAVAAAVEGPLDPRCPASVLRTHASVSLHLDAAAAAGLTTVT